MILLALNIVNTANTATTVIRHEFDNRHWNALDLRWEFIHDDWEADL